MAGETLSVDATVLREDSPLPRLEARFEVAPGITVLFGPSGAGKSTCLHVISGLLKPSRGRVALASSVWCDVSRGIDRPAHQRRVALVFQSLALFPHLSAWENVAYGMPDKSKAGAIAWLDKMKVKALAQQRPAKLSGGEAQRVALARALASAPRVLLLDEPFSSLDLALRLELRREVERWVTELSIPTLLVTHEPEEASGKRVVRLPQLF